MKRRLKIGVALGGGSALGFAHIGVLKVLEEYGLKPDFIAGASMGSVVGGLYATGKSIDELKEIAADFKLSAIRDVQFKSILKTGLFSTDKLIDFINEKTNFVNIEDLKIPFLCNAVDLYSGKEYIFKSGNLGEAVRSSSAIPGVFTPFEKNGKLFIDGGVLNNVPYDKLRKMGADFIIAVDVSPNYYQKQKVGNVIDILSSSFSIMQKNLSKEKLIKDKDKIDYYLSIESANVSTDYSQEAIQYAINLGEKVARENIEVILKKFNKYNSIFKAKKFKKNNQKIYYNDEVNIL